MGGGVKGKKHLRKVGHEPLLIQEKMLPKTDKACKKESLPLSHPFVCARIHMFLLLPPLIIA